MTLPTDTTPLYRAVVRALTEFTGQPRCLQHDRLFKLGTPMDVTDGARSTTVFRQARVGVPPIVTQPIDPQLQLSNLSRFEATVEIRCWYYAHDLHTSEWFRVLERIEADKIAVGAALTYPGALAVDALGNETGLDGGSLRADGGRWQPRQPIPLPRAPRVYQQTHVFRAGVELASLPIT